MCSIIQDVHVHVLQAVVTDVQAHEETLEQLESAVNDVITLVDDSDQSELGSRLQSVSLRYHCHSFSCQCYPVERWLDDRSLQLCSMAPCGVMVTQLQVCVLMRDENEGRKKQARLNKQQLGKTTQHTQDSHLS